MADATSQWASVPNDAFSPSSAAAYSRLASPVRPVAR